MIVLLFSGLFFREKSSRLSRPLALKHPISLALSRRFLGIVLSFSAEPLVRVFSGKIPMFVLSFSGLHRLSSRRLA